MENLDPTPENLAPPEHLDAKQLNRLRDAFLSASPVKDYWQSATDLELYHRTFARRIGWKWDAVLAELTARGWSMPKDGPVIDWACGSGVATERVLAWLAAQGVSASERTWTFVDRSAWAVQFAAAAARRQGLTSGRAHGDELQFKDFDGAHVLLSHVATELDPKTWHALVRHLEFARSVIWVEPGTMAASRRLIEAREVLRTSHRIVAPCPHQSACGLAHPARANDWCHHFAPSPPEVYTTRSWRRFAEACGIDLRSLPVSFLVADRDAVRDEGAKDAYTWRRIGKTRDYKGYSRALLCQEGGVDEMTITRRKAEELYAQVTEDAFFVAGRSLMKLP